MRVLLGVSGGIAAYKAAYLVREFVKRGDEVRVMMTKNAGEFISSMTLQILSEESVGSELFDPTWESEIGHIELARWPDVILMAPATANVLARVAHGMADDLVTTVLCATTAPIVFAPAMNTQMYLNPMVQRNLEILRGIEHFHVVTPDSGELACKEVGPGRLPDPPILLGAVERVVSAKPLEGQHVVITAGPTREHMDPARFISNPSSGKMGYALAHAAWVKGARVTLVSGPTQIDAPPFVEVVPVTSAKQMHDAVWAHAEGADIIIKAAAVADWRPKAPSEQKRTKDQMSEVLELERTADILKSLCARFGPGQEIGPFIVGFAAESHDVVARGEAKLARKNAHMLVANQIGGAMSTFGADQATGTVLTHTSIGGGPVRVGPGTKAEVAHAILEQVARTKAAYTRA